MFKLLLSTVFVFILNPNISYAIDNSDLLRCGPGLDPDLDSEAQCVNAADVVVDTDYWIDREKISDDNEEAIEENFSQAQADIKEQKDQAADNANIMYGLGGILITVGGACSAQIWGGVATDAPTGTTATCPAGASTFYLMGAMSMVQTLASEQYIKDATRTGEALANNCDGLDANVSCKGFDGDGDGNTSLLPGGLNNPELTSAINTLEGLGVKFDPKNKTIKTSKGTFPMSTASTPGGMNSMGFSGVNDAFDKMDRATKKLGGKPSVIRMALGGGGGGGGSAYNPGPDPFATLFDRFNKKKKRKPATAKGKSKLIAGQQIGVKGEDIFDMIHRRYKRKGANNGFVK